MKNRKELNNKADTLLREIGEIDDRLLEEAVSYRPEAKKSFNFNPIAIAVAACLAAVFIGVRILPDAFVKNEGVGDLPQLNAPEEEKDHSLDALLCETKNGGYMSVSSAAELSYTSGAEIVWRFEGEEQLYYCHITDKQYQRLMKLVASGREVGESSPSLECMIWIIDGKGNVTSPYLKSSGGNVGCTIFDYDAEMIPTESFVNYIAEVIS